MESYLGRRGGRLVCWRRLHRSCCSDPLPPSPSQEQLGAEKRAVEYDSKMLMSSAVSGGSVRSVEKKYITTVEKMKKGQRKCITSQPPIIAHYYPEGGGEQYSWARRRLCEKSGNEVCSVEHEVQHGRAFERR